MTAALVASWLDVQCCVVIDCRDLGFFPLLFKIGFPRATGEKKIKHTITLTGKNNMAKSKRSYSWRKNHTAHSTAGSL